MGENVQKLSKENERIRKANKKYKKHTKYHSFSKESTDEVRITEGGIIKKYQNEITNLKIVTEKLQKMLEEKDNSIDRKNKLISEMKKAHTIRFQKVSTILENYYSSK